MRVGEYYFFSKNDGLQNQSVHYVQKSLDGSPEVFIDPNALSADGTVRIGLLGPSGDKTKMAISRGEAGSDWGEIRVMDIAGKKELSDRILWVKFSGAAWWKDGFFYSGYDKPAAGQELTAKNEFQKVFYHKLGDPQEKDTLVYEDKLHPLRYLSLSVSEDERFAFLTVSEGTSGTELYGKDLSKKDAPFTLLIPGFEADSFVIDNLGDRFLVQTNLHAPNVKIVLIDPKAPAEEKWTTIIPEKAQVLSGAGMAGGMLFCSYLQDSK
jgi:prolyl oligopeptidase